MVTRAGPSLVVVFHSRTAVIVTLTILKFKKHLQAQWSSEMEPEAGLGYIGWENERHKSGSSGGTDYFL